MKSRREHTVFLDWDSLALPFAVGNNVGTPERNRIQKNSRREMENDEILAFFTVVRCIMYWI